MKSGLVLEGGALRTIFSSGVCDAFLDLGLPMPDYTIGVSAGLAYGVSYLSRQSRRNLKLVTTYANDPRYMSLRNLANPKNRSYFGLKFAYETIPQRLLPFDYDTFDAYPGSVEVVVTNLETGKAEYLPLPRRDCPNLLLEASCAIPLLFPAIEVNGQSYYDGGCSDPIPWKRAFDAGCDRVVVVLTRERDYRKGPDKPSARWKPLSANILLFWIPCAIAPSSTTPAERNSLLWKKRAKSSSLPPRIPSAVPAQRRTLRFFAHSGKTVISPVADTATRSALSGVNRSDSISI